MLVTAARLLGCLQGWIFGNSEATYRAAPRCAAPPHPHAPSSAGHYRTPPHPPPPFFLPADPASVPCLHEMAWWPLIASVFPGGSFAAQAMQLELSAFATCGWQPAPWTSEGEHTAFSCDLAVGAQYGLSQRWASSGFYWCPWGPLQDQNPMFPIAVAQTAATSGDIGWLRSMLPALRAVQAYLASRGLALGNGSAPVVFTSPASG